MFFAIPRPFGEWNCRHTWAPILLDVSPRAYTDEELERFERYSTEEVGIDGKAHTRYEWSQVMRAMETRIRAEKDTATLARYAGDDVLRRECQGRIVGMMDRYERLSEQAGLGPEYRRTYVAGFRDADEKELTGAVGAGIIRTRETGTKSGGKKSKSKLAPGYDAAVESGDISALTGFDTYEATARAVEKELLGLTTSGGLKAKGYKTHFIDRVIGSYEQRREPVLIEDVKAALLQPKAVKKK